MITKSLHFKIVFITFYHVCFSQVHDLLLPLIKNLEAGPVLHLYEIMKELPVKEHTEQTIHLAQILQKFIWTSGGTFSHLLQEASALQVNNLKNITSVHKELFPVFNRINFIY